jgi:hypothetical protein
LNEKLKTLKYKSAVESFKTNGLNSDDFVSSSKVLSGAVSVGLVKVDVNLAV